MKKTYLTIGLMLICFNSYCQSVDITNSQITATIDLIAFKPVKLLKQFKGVDLKKFIYYANEQSTLRQLNIDARYLCRNKKEENYEVYNLYYKKISKDTYDLYCKEINILMEMDGVIAQPR